MHSGILLPSLWEPYFPSPFFHSWPQIFCLLFNELHLKVHSLALQRWREFWDFDAPVKEIFLELSSTQFSGVSLLSGFFLLCVWLQWAASERCGANCKVQTVNWNVQCDCATCPSLSARFILALRLQVWRLAKVDLQQVTLNCSVCSVSVVTVCLMTLLLLPNWKSQNRKFAFQHPRTKIEKMIMALCYQIA